MRWVKVLAIILGSVWLIPVSCTTGVYVGIHVIAAFDKRDAQRGDTVHDLFKVAAEPGEEGRQFRVLGKNQIAPYMANSATKADASVSFRMSAPSASISLEGSRFSYQVLEDTGQEQLIELIETYDDGDNTIWSRYKATRSTVLPLSSRMFYFGYMFAAVPYAFFGALLLYGAGRRLRRRFAAPAVAKEDS